MGILPIDILLSLESLHNQLLNYCTYLIECRTKNCTVKFTNGFIKGDVDEENRIVLADIIDAGQTIFEDRNNIGIGKTWYYQIDVHNQFGRTSKSNIKSGKSKP